MALFGVKKSVVGGWSHFFAFFCALLLSSAAPVKSTMDATAFLRHELGNHEAQLSAIEERLENYEATGVALHQQLINMEYRVEQLQAYGTGCEKGLIRVEATAKALEVQIQQMYGQYKELMAAVAPIEQQQREQKEATASLRIALETLIEALQRDGEQPEHDKSYRVKAGDTLEKIAKAHQTTARAIKECNNMKSDRIVIGRKLCLP